MLGPARIKFIRSLQQKKFRKLHGCFIAEGDKIVSELLQGSFVIDSIYALPDWISEKELAGLVTSYIVPVSEKELERISGLTNPNRVLAIVKTPESTIFPAKPPDVSLYIDGLQDPGNFGTIIRTADWFGIRQIFCSANTVELYSPKVIQATMGSFMRVSIHYTDLSALRQVWTETPAIFGASLHGDSLFDHVLQKPAMIVIGNESLGISQMVNLHIDTFLRIPGGTSSSENMSRDTAESLNAAVAAAICMAWASK